MEASSSQPDEKLPLNRLEAAFGMLKSDLFEIGGEEASVTEPLPLIGPDGESMDADSDSFNDSSLSHTSTSDVGAVSNHLRPEGHFTVNFSENDSSHHSVHGSSGETPLALHTIFYTPHFAALYPSSSMVGSSAYYSGIPFSNEIESLLSYAESIIQHILSLFHSTISLQEVVRHYENQMSKNILSTDETSIISSQVSDYKVQYDDTALRLQSMKQHLVSIIGELTGIRQTMTGFHPSYSAQVDLMISRSNTVLNISASPSSIEQSPVFSTNPTLRELDGPQPKLIADSALEIPLSAHLGSTTEMRLPTPRPSECQNSIGSVTPHASPILQTCFNHAENDVLLCDARLVLVRPEIDDDASRYKSRISTLPYLRDPHYPDEKSNDEVGLPPDSLDMKKSPQNGEINSTASASSLNMSFQYQPSQKEKATRRDAKGDAEAMAGGEPNCTTLPSQTAVKKRSRDDAFGGQSGYEQLKAVAESGVAMDISSSDESIPRSKRRSVLKKRVDGMKNAHGEASSEEGDFMPELDLLKLLPPGVDLKAVDAPSTSYSSRSSSTVTSPSGESEMVATLNLSDVAKPFNVSTSVKPKRIEIGTWRAESSHNFEIVAKFHHSKKNLIWEYHDRESGKGMKLVMNYADVSRITVHDVMLKANGPKYVKLSFFYNTKPKLYEEHFKQLDTRRSRSWVLVGATETLEEVETLPQVHSLLFDKHAFLDRPKVGPLFLSPLERLILGDAYFARITRIDSQYSVIGDGYHIVGRKSLEILRDLLMHYLEMVFLYVSLYSMPQLSSSLNFNLHHTFKSFDTYRIPAFPHEHSLGINHEDIQNIAKMRGDFLPSKAEITYYAQITKIGENGIASFRPHSSAPTKAADNKLDVDQLVVMDPAIDPKNQKNLPPQEPLIAGKSNVAETQGMDTKANGTAVSPTSSEGPKPNSSSPTPTNLTNPPSSYQSINSDGAKKKHLKPVKGSDQQKNIRVAIIFSKHRLMSVCGPEVASLWSSYSIDEPNH